MSDIKFDYTGKVALVTGGAAGIGREIALRFAASNAQLVISDINEELGQELVDEIKSKGQKAKFIKCNVAIYDDIKSLIGFISEEYGRLDFACNNAGVEGQNSMLDECSEQNWDYVMNVNLKGLWFAIKEQVPLMRKSGGGSIVNLSSVAGLVGFPSLGAYVSSKHGVIGLSKTAALEFAQNGVRVNCICPGPIMTEMLQRIMDSRPGFKEGVIAGVPQGRIGEVSEIADAVLFLCSKSAGYITGQSLAIDGGMVAQ